MSASRPVPVMGNGIPRSRNSPDGTQPGAACLCRRPWGTLPAFLGGASRPKGCSGEESRGVGYHCVVCVKQVPDTKGITGEAVRDDGAVDRAVVPHRLAGDPLGVGHLLDADHAVISHAATPHLSNPLAGLPPPRTRGG